ncbi:DUF4251 domain-containing protein [Algibacter luteus]|uniref:DUF4251 domain-containing protein n=1 Tax=Algibacter luteus TaxID=1178825 RepID=UPI002593C204|nr:DUF4251 domain-containing protein [Algibacter luteus]WJJ95409.1 DUF4251 domain-containing protein [Algibacter luteus]
MKNYWLVICAFLVLAFSCKSSKSKFTDAEINALETLIESKHYTIESDWANPQVTYAMQQVLNSGLMQRGSSPNAISLIGNPNHLTIKNDSVTSYLPYFGERQMGAAYGDSGAIELQGLIENYEVSKGKRNNYIVKFDAKSKTERFNVIILIFPNLKSALRIQSSSRFPIAYSGRVEAINP